MARQEPCRFCREQPGRALAGGSAGAAKTLAWSAGFLAGGQSRLMGRALTAWALAGGSAGAAKTLAWSAGFLAGGQSACRGKP
jgi:hypothetical protein